MFEEYKTYDSNRVPDNRKQFLESEEGDTFVIGGTNKHTFSLDFQFDRYFKEAYVIFRQSIDNTQILTKSYNSEKKELEIKQIATDGKYIEVEVEDISTEGGMSYEDGNGRKQKVRKYLPTTIHSFITATITPEESMKFVRFRTCYVQLKLVSLHNKVSYSDLEQLRLVEPLDVNTDDTLLDSSFDDKYNTLLDD